MNTKSYIYDKDTCKLVVTLNYTPEELALHHEWYSEWRDGLIIEDHEFTHPKYNPVSQHMEEKTRYELVVEGTEKLNDGEYLGDGMIVAVEPDPELIKPKWNADKHIWEESATQEEIEEALLNAQVEFYNGELEFANKALTEYSCETISKQQFDEVKMYIQEINPYALAAAAAAKHPASFMALTDPEAIEAAQAKQLEVAIDTYKTFEAAKAKRPSVFDRYDREKQMRRNGIDLSKVVK